MNIIPILLQEFSWRFILSHHHETFARLRIWKIRNEISLVSLRDTKFLHSWHSLALTLAEIGQHHHSTQDGHGTMFLDEPYDEWHRLPLYTCNVLCSLCGLHVVVKYKLSAIRVRVTDVLYLHLLYSGITSSV